MPALEDTKSAERQGADAARADDAAPRQSDRAPAATRSWTRSDSRSRTSTPTRAGARKQGGDGGTPIDATVKLFDGQEVNGPVGLRQALLRYSPQFVRMFTEKMMTYALGRGVEYTDMPTVRAIVDGRGQGQQPVLGDRARRREERAVPDESEDARSAVSTN